MRILSVGSFGTLSLDGSIPDEAHIADALERLGHEVIRQPRIDVRGMTIPAGVDFVLLAQWDGYPERLGFKDAGIPVVYWAFDYQPHEVIWHKRLVEEADLYLSKRIADSKYPNWQWLSQDFAPEFLHRSDFEPLYAEEKDIDVLFTGSYLPWATERTELLKAIDKEFDLTVHSFTPDAWLEQGLKNVRGPVMDKGLLRLIPRAKVNISIDHIIEAGYWSDRNAQVMVCGGMVLTRYVPMMESAFGDKVAYFYNTEDCLKKVRKYLDNDFEREHMGVVGQAYAHENLMAANRVKDLLTIVGQKL